MWLLPTERGDPARNQPLLHASFVPVTKGNATHFVALTKDWYLSVVYPALPATVIQMLLLAITALTMTVPLLPPMRQSRLPSIGPDYVYPFCTSLVASSLIIVR